MGETSASNPSSRPLTRGEAIYHELREQIAAGDLKSGQWVSVRELSERMGVSFAPVSDAFRRLQQDGLLETEPNRGSRVAALDVASLKGEYAIRMAIEAEAAKRAAAYASDAEIAELADLAVTLDTVLASHRPYEESHGLDVEFHLRIATVSGEPVLRDWLERTQLRLLLARSNELVEQRGMQSDAITHKAIVDAIRAHDGDEASRLVRVHCAQALERQLGPRLSR